MSGLGANRCPARFSRSLMSSLLTRNFPLSRPFGKCVCISVIQLFMLSISCSSVSGCLRINKIFNILIRVLMATLIGSVFWFPIDVSCWSPISIAEFVIRPTEFFPFCNALCPFIILALFLRWFWWRGKVIIWVLFWLSLQINRSLINLYISLPSWAIFFCGLWSINTAMVRVRANMAEAFSAVFFSFWRAMIDCLLLARKGIYINLLN